MILKSLLPVLSLGFSFNAFADFAPFKAVNLHCQSPSGELVLQANADQSSYELALVANGKTKLVVLNPGQIYPHGKSSVSLTKFNYEDSDKDFITLSAYLTKPEWHPAYTECAATRVPGQCFDIHHDGFWGNSYTDEISINVKPLGDGKFQLLGVQGEKYGIQSAMPLGLNVVCEGLME